MSEQIKLIPIFRFTCIFAVIILQFSNSQPVPYQTAWSCLIPRENGIDRTPENAGYSIVVDGSNVYVGGKFATANGGTITLNNMAKYTGSGNNWATVGSGINDAVRKILNYDSKMYVVGDFDDGVKVLNGNQFETVNGGVDADVVNAISYKNNLVISGYFTKANVGDVGLASIATLSGNNWNNMSNGAPNPIFGMTIMNGFLYVGGTFTQVGNINAKYLAKWDGFIWAAVGDQDTLDSGIMELVSFGDTLYAAGDWSAGTNKIDAVNVAQYTEANGWKTLGGGYTAGCDNDVNALAVSSSGILYLGGEFSTCGDTNAFRVAAWDGSKFYKLGDFMIDATVHDLAIYGSTLYATGSFGNCSYVATRSADLPTDSGAGMCAAFSLFFVVLMILVLLLI